MGMPAPPVAAGSSSQALKTLALSDGSIVSLVGAIGVTVDFTVPKVIVNFGSATIDIPCSSVATAASVLTQIRAFFTLAATQLTLNNAGVLTLTAVAPNSQAHASATTLNLTGTGFVTGMLFYILPAQSTPYAPATVTSFVAAAVSYAGDLPAGLYDCVVALGDVRYTFPASLTLT